ncbi:MAG: transposase, partial [Nanoarchaeota archaeon]|nr:transposase [Nanoarchaeota archaeon]
LSRKYITNYGFIAVEDLKVSNMVRNHHLAKSISDVSWSRFIQFLEYKAENAGVQVVKVNPRYTSQICSGCGDIVKKSLQERTHRCSCGLEIDRDLNASRNILKLGLEQSFEPLESGAIPSERKATSDDESGSQRL